MTPETEKLEDALNWLKDRINTKERVKASLDWQDMKAEADYEKMNIDNLKVIEQAARRYAEVLPLLGEVNKINKLLEGRENGFSLSVLSLQNKRVEFVNEIAAIVARGE